MSIYFDYGKPGQLEGKEIPGFVRAGLEYDDPAQPELAFTFGSLDEERLSLVLETMQRYTRWLDTRGFLTLPHREDKEA